MENTEAKIEALSQALERERQTRERLEAELAEARAAAEAAEQARQEFISLVTHELRVPMTSIKGYSDLLLKGVMGPLTDMQRTYMGVIRINVERMARMVSDLSDINKIEGHRLKLEIDAVPIAEAVEAALRPYRARIEEKNQTLTVNVPDTLPPVRANRERLVQIVGNLVSNAHNYTPEGGQITITASTEGNTVHLAVQDNGIGILEEEQPRVFEKFFRASDEETRQIPGNGLALHVTKLLVELQGGRIWFESRRGEGSTFHITLPTAEV